MNGNDMKAVMQSPSLVLVGMAVPTFQIGIGGVEIEITSN